jgi:thymidine phosphorylase
MPAAIENRMQAAQLIRIKRDGGTLPAAVLADFMRGVADGSVCEAQVGAFAMAVWLRGMDRSECAALTTAMRDSGKVLDWRGENLGGPLLDKHSTGGVGDLASLVLAPMLAACGAFVPMVSGRGLGHTGGTLDKLEAIPGYIVRPDHQRLRQCVHEAGCAIVAADEDLAPADRRLYAVRDVTATVDSIPLMVASILSKKLAAGLDALVLDVKTGSGAQTPTLDGAQQLAEILVAVATQAGLPTRALITDMQQPLADTIGNALELRTALRYLRGDARPPRLHALVLALGGELLQLGGLATDESVAQASLQAALDSGAAAERFGRMVALLGGPSDLLEHDVAHLAQAPVGGAVTALDDGHLHAIDARALGEVVVALGGGRSRPDDRIDSRVGLSGVRTIGDRIRRGEPLAWVHAATPGDLAAAVVRVRNAFHVGPEATQAPALLLGRVPT